MRANNDSINLHLITLTNESDLDLGKESKVTRRNFDDDLSFHCTLIFLFFISTTVHNYLFCIIVMYFWSECPHI